MDKKRETNLYYWITTKQKKTYKTTNTPPREAAACRRGQGAQQFKSEKWYKKTCTFGGAFVKGFWLLLFVLFTNVSNEAEEAAQYSLLYPNHRDGLIQEGQK